MRRTTVREQLDCMNHEIHLTSIHELRSFMTATLRSSSRGLKGVHFVASLNTTALTHKNLHPQKHQVRAVVLKDATKETSCRAEESPPFLHQKLHSHTGITGTVQTLVQSNGTFEYKATKRHE